MKPRVHIIWISSLMILSVIFVACSKDPSDPPTPAPVLDTTKPKDTTTSVTSFLPLEATGDDPVKIFGKNLSSLTAVSFGGRPAKSFTLISDSVILAYVSPGSVSGNVSITLAARTFTLPGFLYYTPQVFVLYGTSRYATLYGPDGGTPTTDSSRYTEIFVKDTCSFQLRKVNPYDTLRNWYVPNPVPHVSPKQRSKYADSANYVMLSGVEIETTPFYAPSNSNAIVYRFVPASFGGVYAKIENNVITIPKQTPLTYLVTIWGSGTINNGVITLQYFVEEYRHNSKMSTLSGN
jgi:hypothetical protein